MSRWAVAVLIGVERCDSSLGLLLKTSQQPGGRRVTFPSTPAGQAPPRPLHGEDRVLRCARHSPIAPLPPCHYEWISSPWKFCPTEGSGAAIPPPREIDEGGIPHDPPNCHRSQSAFSSNQERAGQSHPCPFRSVGSCGAGTSSAFVATNPSSVRRVTVIGTP